ncbi:MAG TPA: hypothetical protein VFU27_02680 [Terriglobales bacterium]|nr:hypothetical protein [Terriglobales bacterium]
MRSINKLGPWVIALAFALSLAGCGSSSKYSSTPPPILVSISPNPTASMNLGSTLQFNASATQNKTFLATTVKFLSTNPKILTFAPSGLACAGVWDSAFIVCNPGGPGVVQVFASASGAHSATTTVYVHPQVTSIRASSLSSPQPACVSQNQTENFEATVYSGSSDITSFVGPLTWSALEPLVAKIGTTVSGLQPNQVQITAGEPGLTHVFASVSGLNGQSVPFETCPVQAISVIAPGGTDFLSLQAGSSTILGATAVDTQGKAIKVNGLTWITAQPGVATTKNGSVTAVNPGGAAITPSCTPPGCNVNLYGIYSGNVVKVTVTGAATAETVYVASAGCAASPTCHTSLIPINTQSNTAGTAIALPSPPNSMVVDPAGAKAYFGTAAGLRILSTSTNSFTGANNVSGKVLAASPDGTHVVVSNTTSSPNVVFIVDAKAGTSSPLLLSGVTAAAFSPDGTTAYLLAGTTMYVYSSIRALQTIALPGAATDAAFLTTGAFGFVGTQTSSVSLFDGCDNAAPQSPNTPTVATTGQPALLASLPDGKTIAAVTSPGLTTIDISTSAAGCPPPVTATPTFHDLGQGSFTPKQILVSSEGTHAYVVSNLNAIMVYDITAQAATAIPLAGNATPLSAAVTLSGKKLYVGASDGTVHVLNAVAPYGDVGQIRVTLCSNTSLSCPPNLVALKP